MPDFEGGWYDSGGAGGGTLAQEVPGGDIDGSNKVFTTSVPFTAGSTRFYVNGVRQKLTDDYSETPGSGTMTLVVAPLPGSNLLVDFYEA